MTKEFINKAIINCKEISPTEACTLISTIDTYIGFKSISNGCFVCNKKVDIQYKKRKREIYMVDGDTYYYIINPVYRNEFKWKKGLEDKIDGMYKHNGNTYYILTTKDKESGAVYKIK